MSTNIPDEEIENLDNKAWYALYTKPRAEFKAALQISEAGVLYYLPTITRIKQWSDRKKKVTEALLTGYIFIFADEKERITALEQYSVVRCVFDRGRPAKIPGWQIDNLRKVLQTKQELSIQEGLVPGVKVEIREGPFEGVIGVIQEYDNGNNIIVSIDLLNRSVITHLPTDSRYKVIKD